MSSREEFPSSLELYCKCKSEFVHFHAYSEEADPLLMFITPVRRPKEDEITRSRRGHACDSMLLVEPSVSFGYRQGACPRGNLPGSWQDTGSSYTMVYHALNTWAWLVVFIVWEHDLGTMERSNERGRAGQAHFYVIFKPQKSI